uniref:DNA methyltransferase n=1 Tax=Eubacterium sp. TaxID=142586 RepID=UPI004028D2A5
MDKLKMQTVNKADENFKKLAEMFPNAVTETITGYDENGKAIVERAIDKDVLMQEISCKVVDGNEERYQFTWPDKKKSVLLANAPINKTLRPVRDDETTPTGADSEGKPYCSSGSVNFDNTENLYIEGDNLEVLKLLQETYLGKIKMIYIDPPYNTGNDFVYEDDFAQSTDEYLANSGQFDEDGNRLVKNLDSNGRFHTDWLNMIYPRLKLAKDLLSDDGVIFISIDDNEVENLIKLCNEVFAENNFVSTLVWQKKTGASDAKGIATITENIVIYAKNQEFFNSTFTKNSESYDINRYKYQDEFYEERGPYYIDNLDRGGLSYSDSLNYEIICPDGTVTYPNGRKEYVNDGWIWKWSKQKIEWARKNKFIEFRKTDKKDSGWSVCYKNYLKVDNEGKPIERAAPHKNLITDVLNANAASIMKTLFNTNNYFNYSKPVELIGKLIGFVKLENEYILDFFSGSATTAHAVMQLNAEDGGHRKFIMVQLPEVTDEKSEAYKAGYKNICEIGKERIRRAAKKIVEENPETKFDGGFRVLKCDSSNMKDVYYNPAEYEQSLFTSLEDNIKEDRTPEDLLFQVMLDLGILLSSKIQVRSEKVGMRSYSYFDVEDGYLIACFDKNIDEEVITAIAKQKPYYFVMRDSSMANDSVATNFEQIFATYSPDTVR